MYEYLNGKIVELTPTYLIIETGGIAFFVHISLNTFSFLDHKDSSKIYIHQIIREDAHLLFGFGDKKEREIFRLLISVSGIGANTARLVLSSLKPEELRYAIQNNNIVLLKNIKGIGDKTAQRIIIELKDKTDKSETDEFGSIIKQSAVTEEAVSALIMLGFQKNKIEKAVQELYNKDKTIHVEELVKKALKSL
jgi:Holliday junction DNA helicase RuvA